MGGVGPPKCKTCGKMAWRHLCSGGVVWIAGVPIDEDGEPLTAMAHPIGKPTRRLEPRKESIETVEAPSAIAAFLEASEAKQAPKRGRPKKGSAVAGTDRKAYQASKQREYRAKKRGK